MRMLTSTNPKPVRVIWDIHIRATHDHSTRSSSSRRLVCYTLAIAAVRATKSDGHSRHPHGKEVDHSAPPVWLEDIPREQTVVNARVLIFFQLWQALLPDIDHLDGSIRSTCKFKASIVVIALQWQYEEYLTRFLKLRGSRRDTRFKSWNDE